jgi:hypothetical protein
MKEMFKGVMVLEVYERSLVAAGKVYNYFQRVPKAIYLRALLSIEISCI